MENEVSIQNLIDNYNNGKSVDIKSAMSALKEMKEDRDRYQELFTDYSTELQETKEDVKNMRKAFEKIYEMCLPILDSGRYETSDMKISEIALEHKD